MPKDLEFEALLGASRSAWEAKTDSDFDYETGCSYESFSNLAGWAKEVTTADPGQDPRGAPDLMPLWTMLDSTPEGRPAGWYPKLAYFGQADLLLQDFCGGSPRFSGISI